MTARGRALRLALVVGIVLVGGSRFVQAAKLPDWARAIADEAPPIPEGSPEDEARVLFEETRVIIDESGMETTRWRTATQILGSHAPSLKRQGFWFQEGARLKTYRGWHLPEGDKARRAYQDPTEIAVGDNFLDDLKARSVSVGGLRRGSLVFFEFEIEETPIELSLLHRFGNDEETLFERFEVNTPPGWTLKSDWPRGGEHPRRSPATSGRGSSSAPRLRSPNPWGPPPRRACLCSWFPWPRPRG